MPRKKKKTKKKKKGQLPVSPCLAYACLKKREELVSSQLLNNFSSEVQELIKSFLLPSPARKSGENTRGVFVTERPVLRYAWMCTLFRYLSVPLGGFFFFFFLFSYRSTRYTVPITQTSKETRVWNHLKDQRIDECELKSWNQIWYIHLNGIF